MNYNVLDRLCCRPVVFVTNFIPGQSTNQLVQNSEKTKFIEIWKLLLFYKWSKKYLKTKIRVFKNEKDGYKRDFALIILFIKRQSNDRKIRWIYNCVTPFFDGYYCPTENLRWKRNWNFEFVHNIFAGPKSQNSNISILLRSLNFQLSRNTIAQFKRFAFLN